MSSSQQSMDWVRFRTSAESIEAAATFMAAHKSSYELYCSLALCSSLKSIIDAKVMNFLCNAYLNFDTIQVKEYLDFTMF